MPRYIAFLRAINVGGRVVKMQQVRELFESLQFSNVQTFIASGNVVFETKAAKTATLEKRIEEILFKGLGYEVSTMIRTAADLLEISNNIPFAKAELESAVMLNIVFLGEPLDPSLEANLFQLKSHHDNFHVRNREVYWLSKRRFSESDIAAKVSKILGKRSTSRGAKTVQQITEKYCRG